jgi:hypothetical protein
VQGHTPEPDAWPRSKTRANENAFAIAAAVGAVVWLVVYIFSGERADHNEAYAAGASMATALISAVLVAIVAWASRTRWPMWRYPVLIGAIALGLTLRTAVVDDPPSSTAAPSAAADPVDSARTQERRTAAAPATVGSWTRDDSTTAKAQLQPALDQWKSAAGADGDTAKIALYGNGGQQAVLLVITTQPGSRLDEQASGSSSQAAVDVLAGAGVEERSMVDPGPLGGALGCGPSTKDQRLYVCAWVEFGMLGTLTFVDAQLTADMAAETARQFRSATED